MRLAQGAEGMHANQMPTRCQPGMKQAWGINPDSKVPKAVMQNLQDAEGNRAQGNSTQRGTCPIIHTKQPPPHNHPRGGYGIEGIGAEG